jgi:hypothetical protein
MSLGQEYYYGTQMTQMQSNADCLTQFIPNGHAYGHAVEDAATTTTHY